MPDITAGFPAEPAVFLPSCFRRRDLDRPAPCRYSPLRGPIAQLVEPPAHNRQVPGSRPGGPTTQASCGQQERAGRFFCAQHGSPYDCCRGKRKPRSTDARAHARLPTGYGMRLFEDFCFPFEGFLFFRLARRAAAPPGTVFCQPWNRPGMGKPREQGVICAEKRPPQAGENLCPSPRDPPRAGNKQPCPDSIRRPQNDRTDEDGGDPPGNDRAIRVYSMSGRFQGWPQCGRKNKKRLSLACGITS